MNNKRHPQVSVMFIAGNARSLIANRGDLISELLASGWSVAAAVPREEYLHDVKKLGIPVFQFDMNRTSMKPLKDIRTFFQLSKLMRSLRPKAVFAYTIKPIVYGLPAAWLMGVNGRYAMVTGLGHVYTTVSRRTMFTRRIVDRLYALALSKASLVFFQNPDDSREFDNLGILKDTSKAVVVSGSGVNLSRFPVQPIPTGRVHFVFIGRLLTEKGIAEFVDASKRIAAKWPDALFAAVGGHDASLPHAVSEADLRAWQAGGPVDFVGSVEDVRPWLAASSVVVLPSYREGTPRAVLEGMATGRAIVTSDAPGCRETVVDGVNGYLVKPRDVESLVLAMERYLVDKTLLRKHGEASSAIAREKYEVGKVNRMIIRSMGLCR